MLTTVKKLTCYRLTGNFFKMTSKRVDELIAVLSAANLRCRVLPRVRPHHDLRWFCTPICGGFSAGGLTRGKTLRRRGEAGVVADCRGYAPRFVAANRLSLSLNISFSSFESASPLKGL